MLEKGEPGPSPLLAPQDQGVAETPGDLFFSKWTSQVESNEGGRESCLVLKETVPCLVGVFCPQSLPFGSGHKFLFNARLF